MRIILISKVGSISLNLCYRSSALTVATENGIPTLPTLTYLANTISANDKTVPYSTIVALPTDKGEFSAFINKHTNEAAQLRMCRHIIKNANN